MTLDSRMTSLSGLSAVQLFEYANKIQSVINTDTAVITQSKSSKYEIDFVKKYYL